MSRYEVVLSSLTYLSVSLVRIITLCFNYIKPLVKYVYVENNTSINTVFQLFFIMRHLEVQRKSWRLVCRELKESHSKDAHMFTSNYHNAAQNRNKKTGNKYVQKCGTVNNFTKFRATEFYKVVPNIRGSSVWHVFHVTILARNSEVAPTCFGKSVHRHKQKLHKRIFKSVLTEIQSMFCSELYWLHHNTRTRITRRSLQQTQINVSIF